MAGASGVPSHAEHGPACGRAGPTTSSTGSDTACSWGAGRYTTLSSRQWNGSASRTRASEACADDRSRVRRPAPQSTDGITPVLGPWIRPSDLVSEGGLELREWK